MGWKKRRGEGRAFSFVCLFILSVTGVADFVSVGVWDVGWIPRVFRLFPCFFFLRHIAGVCLRALFFWFTQGSHHHDTYRPVVPRLGFFSYVHFGNHFGWVSGVARSIRLGKRMSAVFRRYHIIVERNHELEWLGREAFGCQVLVYGVGDSSASTLGHGAFSEAGEDTLWRLWFVLD